MLLYFAEDKRVKALFDSIRLGKILGYTGELNIAEFYYKTCEKLGKDVAELRHSSLRNSNINVVEPDENLTRLAAQLKCTYKRTLSLADAYVLATAKSLGTKLITTDSTLAPLNILPIDLVRLPNGTSRS